MLFGCLKSIQFTLSFYSNDRRKKSLKLYSKRKKRNWKWLLFVYEALNNCTHSIFMLYIEHSMFKNKKYNEMQTQRFVRFLCEFNMKLWFWFSADYSYHAMQSLLALYVCVCSFIVTGNCSGNESVPYKRECNIKIWINSNFAIQNLHITAFYNAKQQLTVTFSAGAVKINCSLR